jgi:tape measure domain-containing protein
LSLNVGSLWADLSLNISQFTAAFATASATASSAAGSMSRAFGSGPQRSVNNTAAAVDSLNRKINLGGKDLQRIVGGILVSQAFYKITNAISDASVAVVTFANNMDNARIAFEYFVGSKDKADAFLRTMQDFAATTPFTTEQAVQSSKRLMAMGFAAQNVKSVLTVMTDAAAATGGTAEQMDRIVLALGQMKTNGFIAGQELRQLAEAGIPAYKILQEELGLTAKEIKNIGKLKINGDLGVSAILNGLQKRYKGASDKIAQTLFGMWSTIKDDF